MSVHTVILFLLLLIKAGKHFILLFASTKKPQNLFVQFLISVHIHSSRECCVALSLLPREADHNNMRIVIICILLSDCQHLFKVQLLVRIKISFFKFPFFYHLWLSINSSIKFQLDSLFSRELGFFKWNNKWIINNKVFWKLHSI